MVHSTRFRRSRLTRLLALAGLLAAAPAIGATGIELAAADLTDLALEDLLQVEVTTASKYKQDAREAPSQVQVITAEEIRQYGWRTVGEALGNLPGFYTSDDGVYQYLGARGFLTPGDYSTRFQLLLNGQRLNDNIYEQAQFGLTFPLDMALIERIEVISGPGSAIYGSNALFGVINVIARDPASLHGSNGSIGYTSNGWRELRAATSTRLGENGPNFLASFSYGDKAARDITIPAARGASVQSDTSVSADGVARGLDSGSVARAYFALQHDSGLRVSAWGLQRDVVPPLALYGSAFNDKRNSMYDASYGVAASLDRQIDTDLQFTGRIAYQEQIFSGNFVYAGTPATQSRVDTTGGWISGESRFVYSGFASHKLVFGADAQRDTQLSIRNVDSSTGSVVLDASGNTWRTGVFLQDEWTMAPRWRLSAGARYDRYSIDLAHTSPRLGLVHTLTDSTTVKLLAGQAYRVPNAFERQYEDGYYLANASLKPEIIQTYEAIVEQRMANGQLLGASVYNYNFHDQLDQTTVGSNVQYQNKDRTTVRGAEVFWRAPRLGDGSAFASLGINNASSADSTTVPNSPSWLAKLRATHPLGSPQWQGAIELQAIGPRDVESGA
ncbi:MAG: hypothetical protein RL404_1356, partial [Pseudomonadota bacterium]